MYMILNSKNLLDSFSLFHYYLLSWKHIFNFEDVTVEMVVFSPLNRYFIVAQIIAARN